MSKSKNDAAKNVLDTQQQESASENEESDTISDQSSSSTSESATHPPSSNGKSSQTTQSSSSKAAPQFSVQRSDVDGLRMRISAIRPTGNVHSNTTNSNSIPTSNSSEPTLKERKEATSGKLKTPQTHDKVNNNNTIETLKVKISNTKIQLKEQKQEQQQREQQKQLKAAEASTTKRAGNSSRTKMSVDSAKKDADSTGHKGSSNDGNKASKKHTIDVTPTASAVDSATGVTSTAATSTTNTESSSSTHTLPLSMLLVQAPCLSDVTAESGCSEATTTTIAAGQEKNSAKKIKVKRKKVQSKHSDSKKSLKKSSHQHSTAFSSDSEDDVPQKQRAPRLLLTAINSKASSPLIKPLASLVAANSDNIGLSSSDNELKLDDVVSAAIKRVESDTDDTAGEVFRKAKTKNLPQYQSTLLQDFMEKTQMLGRTPARLTEDSPDRSSTAVTPNTIVATALKASARAELLAANQNSNSQTESIASSSPSIVKKRRGRPKKVVATTTGGTVAGTANTTPTVSATNASNINESADSGVISTTSTAQSSSPLPKLPSNSDATASASIIAPRLRQRNEVEASPNATVTANTSSNTAISPAKSQTTSETNVDSPSTATVTTQKPKIDIAYLDKRMYATERVLYPPPRNKRRQSIGAGAATKSTPQERKPNAMGASTVATKAAKEELQLDPVWSKIDVNKKFRRPSVSGYKSDGGGGNTTICSKILAAKSGYVSDYGSFHPRSHSHHHNSGYKSDASGKSRYSVKSCASRRSRAKSCGYRSDCKESGATLKSTKYRRKRRCALLKSHSKSVGNLNDEQDILQLAGLSLGQSSEESNEYVCKPNLESLPTTSVSKKYGEINRFIATGEYFGRGSSGTFGSGLHAKRSYDTANEDGSQDDIGSSFSRKLLLQRKASCELTHDMLPHSSRKIKSRRSSVASYCSSYYSSTSKVKRRRRRKSFRFPSSSKPSTIDSKLLTEIEIITNTFGTLCRLQSSSAGTADKGNIATSGKDKLLGETGNKVLQTTTAGSTSNKRETRDKRSLKKRKMSENHEFALMSASGGALTVSSGSTKRRHKKASSSSPDDHKLPLKKRHYLLTPGEKSTEAAAAVAAAAKLFGTTPEAWAAAAAAAKSSASSKSQQQFGGKSSKTGLTPKKRHLLQNATHLEESTSSVKGSNSSPLRIVVDTTSISGGKTLDISPISLSSKQSNDSVHKKRTRLEGLVSKIANHSDEQAKESQKHKTPTTAAPQLDSETSCPPPGVFEPSIELAIQIPPIAKLSDTPGTTIITKSEVNSPLLLMDLSKPFPASATKVEGTRVVESLLNKTGGNLLLKRKRKKINRTGFPTVRRKKRRLTEQLLLDVQEELVEETTSVCGTKTRVGRHKAARTTEATTSALDKVCDRVPQAGETSDTFLERASRTPRLSVVALERLQGTPPTTGKTTPGPSTTGVANKAKAIGRPRLLGRKSRLGKEKEKSEEPITAPAASATPARLSKKNKIAVMAAPAGKLAQATSALPRQRGRKPKAKVVEEQSSKLEEELKETKESTETSEPKTAKEAKPTEKTTQHTPTKQPKKINKSPDKPTFSKSTVHKIITAKSLESKVKLPAGIDPNTNFSCKIRLKRRSTFQSPANVTSNQDSAPTVSRKASTPPPNPEDVAVEAAAKDAQSEYLEHDVLPSSVAQCLDSETASDTSDEKSSTTTVSNTTTVRNPIRLKKTYLPAGLFSDYFKTVVQKVQTATPTCKKGEKKETSTPVTAATTNAVVTPTVDTTAPPFGSLLPPPPYCEKYFRRTQIDFQLPYDIWWAYTNSKLPTRITVPSWNYRKIRTNVYAESVRPNTAGIDHPTCNCKADVGCGDNCLNRMVYTECSPSSCPTRDKCRNQKIQRHEVAPGVERFMTENKGWGVRTKLPITKGTYILEYVGEVVTEREFKDRMGTIYLNDTHHYCLHLDGGLVIDGHRMGSDGRFVNHSCQPNCEMQKWSVNGLSRMALFAKRNIESGEELTYDYNFSLFNPSEGQPCRCNTPQCRGVIGGKSQRVKPLPVEVKQPNEPVQKEGRNGRQRKRKARKNIERLQSKDVVVARVQQLSEKEKKLVKQHNVFLVRNFEKIRRCKARRNANLNDSKLLNPVPSAPASPNGNSANNSAAAISNRRPSTPSSLAAQISALCSPRNIKTRGLTLAVQDPEVEKMAKIAVLLRDICAALEALKAPTDDKQSLISIALVNSSANNSKKKKALKAAQKQEPLDLKTVQSNIEQGYYKQPSEFDADMQKIFAEAKQSQGDDETKAKALSALIAAYDSKKQSNYAQLLELVGGDETALSSFRTTEKPIAIVQQNSEEKSAVSSTATADKENAAPATKITNPASTAAAAAAAPTEDIIRCICGLYKDEGLMIQCARCMVWQHTECTKADVKADNYLCERCEPRMVDREIPLDDFTEEGHRYYLTLMRGDLHVRQGDAVYVLRDIPIKDANGKVLPAQKHTYETIGNIDYNECDIFRVERLWKNEQGKRFIFGHHFLRPHETFHEPSRRFYPNEVVRVPLYEVVPIELVIGRCWVLDRTTFCKGRPVECTEEEHCYICELRVDKSARFFSKAKVNYPTCTKTYAFRKFPEKLKISKTYAPHDVDPAMLKTKKQKLDMEASTNSNCTTTAAAVTSASPAPTTTSGKQELSKVPQSARKQRQNSSSPATVHLPMSTSRTMVQILKEKRLRLSNVLKAIKLKWKNTHAAAVEPPIDLSYLLAGRGARQRKTLTAITATTATAAATANVPV